MTYECLIDSPDGYCVARCTDEQIDRLPELSVARFLRDELRHGVYVTQAEIARAYFGEGKHEECGMGPRPLGRRAGSRGL